VPLDFDWPLKKVWDGFITPGSLDGTKCPDCDGGQTHAGWWLQRFCQRITMLDGEPGGARPFVIDRPSADILTLVDGLTGSEGGGLLGYMGTDYRIYRAIVTAAGLENWGTCETCEGKGSIEVYPGQRAEAEAWEPTDPPIGEGWQLWETVSEGSPVSPVFPTAEALAEHLNPVDPAASLAWITSSGWAPTGIMTAAGYTSGSDIAAGAAPLGATS